MRKKWPSRLESISNHNFQIHVKRHERKGNKINHLDILFIKGTLDSHITNSIANKPPMLGEPTGGILLLFSLPVITKK